MSGLIGWDNLIEAATLSISNGESITPLDNLKDRRLARVYRHQVLGIVNSIYADLAAPATVRFAALLGISTMANGGGGTGTIKLHSGGSQVASVNVTPLPIQGAGTVFPGQIMVDFGQHYANIDRVEYVLRATWGDADSIVDIGCAWASNALLLPDGVDSGWSQVAESAAVGQDTRGSSTIVRGALARRRTSYAHTQLDESLVIPDYGGLTPTVLQLAMETAAREPVVVLLRSDSDRYRQALGMYGSFVRVVQYRHLAGPNYAAEFEHLEER